MSIAEKIKQKALELGFDLVGITTAAPVAGERSKAFNKWLVDCCPPNLQYLKNNLDKRFEPAKLLPNAKSVIVAAINYKTPSAIFSPAFYAGLKELTGKVASYAGYEDYHTFIKNKLCSLAEFIKTNVTEAKPQFRICVDSAPIAEKPLAARAGLGFIGKNHLLINPTLGPQLLLGEIVTDLLLKPDKPIKVDCGSCTKCIDACPTKALRPDGYLDARKCISYLTIEHKGNIPDELAEKIGGHLFGCDDCILACPFQHKAPACENKDFRYYPDRANLDLNEILNMTNDAFEERFFDSPILRAGLPHLKSTAHICLENIF